MWKNIAKLGRPQVTVQCLHNACSITKATYTHSEYVITFPMPQRLHKSTSLLMLYAH